VGRRADQVNFTVGLLDARDGDYVAVYRALRRSARPASRPDRTNAGLDVGTGEAAAVLGDCIRKRRCPLPPTSMALRQRRIGVDLPVGNRAVPASVPDLTRSRLRAPGRRLPIALPNGTAGADEADQEGIDRAAFDQADQAGR